MDVYRPLRAGLFIYECLRLLFLVVFLHIAAAGDGFSEESGFLMESLLSGFYMVFVSANALFLLMALFLWLKPLEYRSFISLYLAGKFIALVSLYAWEIFSFRDFPGIGMENAAKAVLLFWGCVLLGIADILSVLGAWTLNYKIRKAAAPERGGM